MKKREGYSLVEFAVIIAIMGIVVGLSALGFAYLTHANSKQLASQINSGLSELRSENMAKSTSSYLHIYSYDDVYYMKINGDDVCQMDGTGTEIGSTEFAIAVDGNGLGDNESYSFHIRKKDGAFTDVGATCPAPSKITIKDDSGDEKTIVIVKDTGKHFIE